MPRRTTIFGTGLVLGGLGVVLAAPRSYRWLRSWGSSADERRAVLPGDDLCPDARVVHTRAVTVEAPPEAVWPWLPQIGQDRSGFYSYTVLENLVGCRMPRVHELREGWQHREPGERMLMAAPDRFGGGAYNVIHSLSVGEWLVTVGPTDPQRLAAAPPVASPGC